MKLAAYPTMKFSNSPKSPAPASATFRGALSNIARGLFNATAKFASYNAASPTATTTVGSRIGSNQNSTYSSIQRAGMQWTSVDLQKNAPLAMAYLRVRGNYCRPTRWKPNTGDAELNKAVSEYCDEKWKTMGFDCSMQAAVARTLHIETPIRGDAGMILWRDQSGDLRLIEFSADQLGEVYNFTPPRTCSIGYNSAGDLREVAGDDCIYFSGRYFRGPDCVAYKIYQRTDSWYSNPRIYDARDVIYSVDPFNFRSMRGVTIFHNVMSCIEKGEFLLQAGLSAAQRQARTAMIVMNESGAPDDTSYASSVIDGRVAYAERLPGGPLTEYFYNGDSANFVSPDSPGPELIAGVNEADQRFCIGLGMTYAFVVSGEKIGGAISRLDANRSGGEIERLREDLCKPVLNRIAQITIMDAVRKRELPAEANLARGNWSYVNLPTADAFKDSMDDIKSVRAGQDSDTRVLARYGTTPEEILRDKEDETFLAYQALHNVQLRLKNAGITLTPSIADIRQITDNPQQAAAAEQIDKGVDVPKASTDTAKMSAPHDVSAENRDEGGKWTAGGGSASSSKQKDKEPKKKGADMKSYMQKQSTHLHETAQKRGHADVNEFAANEPQAFSKTIADFQRDNPRSDAPKKSTLVPAKDRAWNGSPMKVKTKLTKLETDAIGERTVIEWLKSQGFSDARKYDPTRTNAPVDLLQDHELIEVKSGFAGNSATALHWRTTFNQRPGNKDEEEYLAKATKKQKKKWAAAKQKLALNRKFDELAHYTKATGRKASGKMICTIVNPDTKTVDVYEFEGFAMRHAWKNEHTQKSYRGSFKYE